MSRLIKLGSVAIAIALGVWIASESRRVTAQSTASGSTTTLPNGWRISPAGTDIPLPGDLPVRMTVSPDHRTLWVVTAGFHHHSVNIVDIRTQQLRASFTAAQLSPGMAVIPGGQQLLVTSGLALPKTMENVFKRTEDLPTATEGINGDVIRFNVSGGKLSAGKPIVLPVESSKDRYTSGLIRARDGSLFISDANADKVYKLDPSLSEIRASAQTGNSPMFMALSQDEKELAVTNWGDKSVSLFDARTLKEKARIAVGTHPNDLLYAKDGRLFVSNAGSNSVSVIDAGKTTETIKTSITPDDLVGSTPDALAISPDGKSLFVANADNNDIAVVDISHRQVSIIKGFIPTGWFPSALTVSPDGKQLFVGIGKGLGFAANSPGHLKSVKPFEEPDSRVKYDYVGYTLAGSVEIIPVPTSTQLSTYTQAVRANFPNPAEFVDQAQAQRIQREVFPKIKHVLYIIRENRTYDQVLGDMGKGNSDPSLTVFGQDVTPNAHKIAGDGVLLDNLYVNGEVSQNGHEWCTSAYSTEFTSKDWEQRYSGHKYVRDDEDDSKLSSSPAGYIWDSCARHGLSYLSYGEFVNFRSSPDQRPIFTGAAGLDGHYSKAWVKRSEERNREMYEMAPKDPKERAAWSLKSDWSRYRDYGYADVFIDELHDAEKTGQWPSFMVMSLGEDHTDGLMPGEFSPKASVGSNDQAVGKIVEAVSRSRFWPETAIFIIEDDAQNGPDHVDARRTVGLVISPFTKKRYVDHTMYTTASMVRTIEMILGLPPMTQYDALATPMYNSFTTDEDLSAYTNLPPRTDLLARNPVDGEGAMASLKLDFSQYDRADPDELNRILWAALKPGIPMPPPNRSAVPHR
jgi:YVTN family beta-propeller protein